MPRKILAVFLSVLMSGCGLIPGLPFPGDPGEPYDCDNPPAQSGLVIPKGADLILGQYIVVFEDGAASSAISEVRARIAGSRALGSTLRSTLRATLSEGLAKELAKNPAVRFIEQDSKVYANQSAPTWGLDAVDGRGGLDGTFAPDGTGAGAHVAVVDTGVDQDNPDFEGRLGECFVSSGVGSSCDDDHYHGTHVAGTAGGTKWGVAKAVVIDAYKVLNAQGSASTSQVVEGLDAVGAFKVANPDIPVVVNMSLGGGASPALNDAVCRLHKLGVPSVVAAGNESSNACGSSPSQVLQALVVAASDKNFAQASFSNDGACVDIYAPGVNVRSDQPGGGDQELSGTSMASPHVAGAVALYLEKNPGATPDEAIAAVLANGTPGIISGVDDETENLFLYVGPQEQE